jgi:hypothetical protein
MSVGQGAQPTHHNLPEQDAAFIVAEIYLRDGSHLDPTENALPTPEKNTK